MIQIERIVGYLSTSGPTSSAGIPFNLAKNHKCSSIVRLDKKVKNIVKLFKEIRIHKGRVLKDKHKAKI